MRTVPIVVALAVTVMATGVRAAERPAVVVTSGQEQKFVIALQKFAGGPDAEAFREGLAAALDYSSLVVLPPEWGGIVRFEAYLAKPVLMLAPDLVLADRWNNTETTERLR